MPVEYSVVHPIVNDLVKYGPGALEPVRDIYLAFQKDKESQRQFELELQKIDADLQRHIKEMDNQAMVYFILSRVTETALVLASEKDSSIFVEVFNKAMDTLGSKMPNFIDITLKKIQNGK